MARPLKVSGMTDSNAPAPLEDADTDLEEEPAAAGGNDDAGPEQGEGESDSY